MAFTNKWMKPILNRHMDETGDGTGNDSMNVDGSVATGAPTVFKIAPAATELILIKRVIIYVRDTGTFDADKWGNAIVLANGMQFSVKQNGTTTDFGAAMKTSGDLAAAMHDVNHLTMGVGDEIMTGRMTFSKMGQDIRLDGSLGDELQFTVQDLATGLVEQFVTAQGYYAKS